VQPALLINYSPDTKGYRVLELPTGKVSTHRAENLHFEETITVQADYIKTLVDYRFGEGTQKAPDDVPLCYIRTTVRAEAEVRPVGESQSAVGARRSVTKSTATVGDKRSAEESISKRPQRKRRPNVRFSDYVLDIDGAAFAVIQKPTPASMPTDPRKLPLAKDIAIPNSFQAAMKSEYADYWRAAFDEEINSLKAHKVWQLTERARAAEEKKIITCRWHLVVKANEKGQAVRFKARLVIHGFKQVHGIDYHETYAPVIRFSSIRVAIYYAMQRGWAILQYDVKTEFCTAS
jgi:hypothetical protein